MTRDASVISRDTHEQACVFDGNLLSPRRNIFSLAGI